jgi:hypothetical protein
MTKATDLTYRVLKLPLPLRQAIRKTRDEKGVTNQKFVEAAVETHLPVLLDSLRQLGFGSHRGKFANARLPFSDKAKILDILRQASNEVQIPTVRLLEICLASAVSAKPPGRTRRKSTKSPTKPQRKQKRTKASDKK